MEAIEKKLRMPWEFRIQKLLRISSWTERALNTVNTLTDKTKENDNVKETDT